MKKVLIINLRRLGDVFSTSHLINSLTAGGDTQVSLLTYKESAKAAHNLKNVTNVFEIDRKEIISLKTNRLFSDGFALEQLYKQLSPMKDQEWDKIINYSNDTVGAYLTSYLKDSAKEVTGVHFSHNRNIVLQSDWELLFNDILPVVRYAPVHFIDCYHKMAGVKIVKQGEKFKTSSHYNEMAFNHINNIRRTHNITDKSSKIIGIQLKTADAAKDIPEAILHKLVKLIRANSELVPIILIAPVDEERRSAVTFNESHNNELIVVEADLTAIASVLMNIDLLVTPDTAIKHIADLTDTPVVEVSLGHAPFLKQGSYSKEALILTDVISSRSFSKKSEASQSATNITAEDILATVLFALSNTKTIRPRLSDNVTLYQASFDQMGIRYAPTAGTVNPKIEIHRLMSRQLIGVMFDQQPSSALYQEVCNVDLQAAISWTTSEKAVVTNVMKDLLGTLRALIQSTENRKSGRDFVINLGKLINHVEADSLAQIPVSMFKSKIEGINSTSQAENLKEVEVLLYELKTDMQKILQCLKELEAQIGNNKVEDMIKRTSESVKA